MLQSMRHLAQSWLFKGLMLILVISFGIWGIGDIFHGNALQRAVAKTGGVTISIQQLNHEFEDTLVRARQMFGPDLTAQQARQIGLLDTALNTLIQRAEIDQQIKHLGIMPDDRAVLDELLQQPQMRNKDGSLNRALFQQALTQSHVSEQDFFASERQSLARRQLLDALMMTVPVPQTLIDTVAKARGQKRIFDLVILKNNSIKDLPQPDDAMLHDFYQQNAKDFTAPEYRAVTIAKLSTEDIAKEITIGDDQLHKEYDAKGDQLAHPELRNLLQVVLQDEDKAKKLAAAAKASGNLAEAAKAEGVEAVPLDATDAHSLMPELAKPAFALSANQVSEPIKTDLGWHVVQVTKITPAGKPSFEEAAPQLRETMRRDQAIDQITRMVNQLDDDLAAGQALEDIADGMKMRMIKIPALDAQGKTPDGKDPAELPYKADVLKAAFGQQTGETSPVMDDRQGNYFVVRTDDVTPSALRSFDQVKEQVATGWTQVEQEKRATAEAEKIAQALREGKAASSFADHAGVEVRSSKPISLLGDSDPFLPQIVLGKIMQLKKGDAVALPLSGEQLIVRLASVEGLDKDDLEAARAKVNGEIQPVLPRETAEEYLQYLRVLYPVEIHQDALDAISQQGG